LSARREGPGLFRWPWRTRSQVESELDEEVAFHLEMRTEKLIGSGLSPAAARARAVHEFGDSSELRRDLVGREAGTERRRMWRWWIEDVAQDVRFALRSFRKNPGFAGIGLATLGLGIGAAVAMFTVVNAVALKPLPYADPDRLIAVLPGQNANMALADEIRERSPSLAASTGLSIWGLTLTGRGDAALLNAQFADAEFFQVFGVTPAVGRPFRAEEREPSASDVVILSHSLWQGRFGGDPEVIGQRIDLSGYGHDTREVIGVMPAGFEAPLTPGASPIDVWGPLSRHRERTVTTDSTWYVNAIVGRLAPGATVERAAAEIRAAMAVIRAEHGNVISEESVRSAGAMSLLDSMVGEVRGTLLILLSAVGLVLLLACANLANLLLARGERRRQELAMRAAIGGSRGRLLRELLTESIVLALLGGLVGVGVARLILALLRVSDVSGLPRAETLPLDPGVLGFALVLSLGSVVAFGLIPALRVTGDLRPELGSGGRAHGRTRAGRRVGAALITVEVALAMILVTGAGLLLTSLWELRSIDPGMDVTDVLAVEIAPPTSTYDGERAGLLHTEVRERLSALPGVRSVGAIHLLPFTNDNWAFPYLAEGHDPPSDGPLPSANFRVVTPGYFEAVDIPLLAGRAIDETDRAGAGHTMVINRSLASELWPGEEAVGRTINVFGSEPFQVVGVVGDSHQQALDVAVRPEMYVASEQWRVTGVTMMLETDVDPRDLIGPAEAAIHGIDRDVAITANRPLADVLGESMRQRSFFASLLTLFGLLALVLGAVGIYGVMSYAVGARLPEFGIRLALGAAPGEVVRGAVSSGLPHVALGLAIGLTGSFALTGLLAGMLFGVGPRDPLTLAAAALVLGSVALLASWIPARRVSRLDPASVLRGE
jgi:putative ABC transport system permease protein